MRYEINRIQSKDRNIQTYEIDKFPYLVTIMKNIYIKKDTIRHHIFINLLVNK